MKMSWLVRLVFGAVVMVTAPPEITAQEAELGSFQSQLSQVLLGKSSPIGDGGDRTYLGIAIVPPGEAWSLTAGDDALERSPWGTSRLALQFNYPVEVNGGVANVRRQQRLERIWQRVLSGSVPEVSLSSEVLDSNLFRPVDRIDIARGVEYVRTPSEQYLRYQEYAAAWRVLRSTDVEDGAWRLHPRFAKHSSLDEARTHLLDEWNKYGYRCEIEASLSLFEKELATGGWNSWLNAKGIFSANTVEAVPGIPSGRTTLFPAENDWHDMRSWSVVQFASGDITLKCEVARVKVSRPWFDWSLLLSPGFRLGKESDLSALSDGAVPTNDTFSKGTMANIIEELILVRRISGAVAGSGHPLGRFEASNAETPQLIGFVVRSLPALSPEE